MSAELRVAQMNTKAVTAKLAEYESRLASQDGKIQELTAQLAEYGRQLLQLQAVAMQVGSFGSGPTAR